MNIKVGDRFLGRDKVYIVCNIQGLYYLVNIQTGGTWTDGLDYNQLVQEIIRYKFVSL